MKSAPRKSYSGGDEDDRLTCVWSMEDDTCVGADKLFQEFHILWSKVIGKHKRGQGEQQNLEKLEVHNPYTCARTPITPLCLSKCYPPSCPSFNPINLLNTSLKTWVNISLFLALRPFHAHPILGSKISPSYKKLGTVSWQSLKSPKKCTMCINMDVHDRVSYVTYLLLRSIL